MHNFLFIHQFVNLNLIDGYSLKIQQMNQNNSICTHTKQLTKEVLQKIVAKQLTKTCATHLGYPFCYLCLHCGAQLCSKMAEQKNCLQLHSQTDNHNFYLQTVQGSIWCQACMNTIQNQLFDFSGDDKLESIAKLRRFQRYVSDIWSEIAKRSGVKITKCSHRGIKNLGNTCYLSVVLQSLLASNPLRQLYAEIEGKQDKIVLNRKMVDKQIEYFYDDMINKRQSQRWNIVSNKKQRGKQQDFKRLTKTVKNGRFNLIFKKFIAEMAKKEEESYLCNEILNSLGQFNSKYREKQQQDAEQLLLLIIDILNQGERIYFLRDQERYKQVESILGFQKLTPIQSIFGFYLINQVQCAKCKQTSSSINLSYSIALSVEQVSNEEYLIEHKTNKVNIDYWQQLFYPQSTNSCPFLAPFFRIERLNKANNYYQCSKCKNILAFRKYYIVSEPKILIVTLKRFNAKLQKKSNYIEFPQQLSLQGISLDKEHPKYKLYALIVHEGSSMTTGHYICFINIQNQWLKCSDEKIQAVSWNMVKRQQPYVLLYEQQ